MQALMQCEMGTVDNKTSDIIHPKKDWTFLINVQNYFLQFYIDQKLYLIFTCKSVIFQNKIFTIISATAFLQGLLVFNHLSQGCPTFLAKGPHAIYE